MSPGVAIAVAITFVWLGMVLAISFLEAPLKFRAPGVTVPLGLGIGRLVFRALNAVEVVLALLVVISMIVASSGGAAVGALGVAVLMLVIQLVVVRPRLTRRSVAVLAGGVAASRSHAHLAYVGLELIKVLTLGIGGVLLLSSLGLSI